MVYHGITETWPAVAALAGFVLFCGVVVTTMIAALSFDPRLIWDSGDRDEQRYRI